MAAPPGPRAPRHSRRTSTPGDDGVQANARLTASTGAVLFVLLAVEGVTILRIGRLLTLHVVVGLLIVPPVLLKMATTGWRFARYYRGDPSYKEKGPPHPVLRVLGPFVIVLTVAVLATGVALLLAPTSWGSRLLLLHKASFIVWIAVMTVHVLGHLVETGRLAPLDWVGGARRRLEGVGVRRAALVVALIVGGILAAGLYRHIHLYQAARSFRG